MRLQIVTTRTNRTFDLYDQGIYEKESRMESVRDMQLAIQLEEKMEIKLGGREILFQKMRVKNNSIILNVYKHSKHHATDAKNWGCFVYEKSVCDVL